MTPDGSRLRRSGCYLSSCPVSHRKDLIQLRLPSALCLHLHIVSDAPHWLKAQRYTGCTSCERRARRVKTVKLLNQTYVCRTAIAGRNRLIDVFVCVIIWAGRGSVCEALRDGANGVLCLKDCGVWCRRFHLGLREVNYLGLNSYFVPLKGIRRAGGRGSDASWTGRISRSL